MIRARALVFNGGMVLWTLAVGIVALPVLLLGRRATVRVSEIWTAGILRWLDWTVGLGFEIRGAEHRPKTPAIVALKHQSAWDTLVLNRLLRDPAIVFKRELIWLPLVGWYIYRAGMIPVDRSGGAAALRKMLAAGRQALDQGRPIAIFPEGTRGAPGTHHAYQPGVGALYTSLAVPLVPVALNSGLYWRRGAFTKRPGRIIVEFLPPVPIGMPRRQAMALLEERIETASLALLEAAHC